MTPTPTCKINLALQGGGSHGALTWGVLDALLEDGSLVFDGISGTSAGAMNAVALAQGFAKAARQESDPVAAQALGAELARATLTELWEGVGTMGSLMWGAPLPGSPFMGVLNQFFSPYQTNPLDINPLRKLLERVVDFEALTHPPMEGVVPKDRKSTRLNSSHLVISYAVFCLKKKKDPTMAFSTRSQSSAYWDIRPN